MDHNEETTILLGRSDCSSQQAIYFVVFIKLFLDLLILDKFIASACVFFLTTHKRGEYCDSRSGRRLGQEMKTPSYDRSLLKRIVFIDGCISSHLQLPCRLPSLLNRRSCHLAVERQISARPMHIEK